MGGLRISKLGPNYYKKVASLLQPVTKYLLASEQKVPRHGWSYDTMDFSRGKSSSELGQAAPRKRDPGFQGGSDTLY